MSLGKLIPATFTIDDGKRYPGFHDPDFTWNGWACPFFTREVAQQIAADIAAISTDLDPRDVVSVEYDAARDCFVQHDGDEYSHELSGYDTPHGRLYGVGDGWCWDECDAATDA